VPGVFRPDSGIVDPSIPKTLPDAVRRGHGESGSLDSIPIGANDVEARDRSLVEGFGLCFKLSASIAKVLANLAETGKKEPCLRDQQQLPRGFSYPE
jgi:hypothetical protein